MRGQWRFAVMVLGALAVAAAVWTWLPPSATTEAATKDAIARFETAKWLLWPEGRLGETTLPTKVREELEDRRHRSLMTLAEGSALEGALQIDAVGALLREPRLRGGRVPVTRKAEVVYYDFRRRTPHGELEVRAACDIVTTTGKWDPSADEIVDRVEDGPSEWCQLFEYTLKQYGDSFRVVAKEAVSGPHGESTHFFNPTTGEFTQDTGA